MSDDLYTRTPITRTNLVGEFESIGIEAGDVLMVHTSLSSLGCVIGGADTVVEALLQSLGPSGTLLAMIGWDHATYHLEEWPTALQKAYREDPPAFDPSLSEARHKWGRLPERIRTWPGAHNSFHAAARFSAIGALAEWITSDQPWNQPYGPGSPLAKLLEVDGRVLMLGAPLETLTVLHHAEELADVPNKRIIRFSSPIKTPSGVEWRDSEELDTSKGPFPYEEVVGDRDSFEVIGEEALAAGIGCVRAIGESRSVLFPARELVAFGVSWIEKHFS